MKRLVTTLAFLAFLLPCSTFAQYDTREPGIYAIVGEESIPLEFLNSVGSSSSSGFGITKATIEYKKGVHSGVNASDVFVLVIDPDQLVYSADEPFLRMLTPNDMLFIPLDINPESMRRKYDPGMAFGGDSVYVVLEKGGLDFDWERISENSYKITVHGLRHGEYGISFRCTGTRYFDYNVGVFAFSVPKGYLEGMLTEENYLAKDGVMKHVSSAPVRRTPSASDLRKGAFNKSLFEIQMEYVNKSWICSYESEGTQREDFFGDTDTKFLHGWGLGGLFTPSYDWGLGLRTGLFVEFYFTESKWIRDFAKTFSELDLYAPIHVSYRIPFKKNVALNIFGGAGFQWAVTGSYSTPSGTSWTGLRPSIQYESVKQEYGNGWPKRFNTQAELGLNYRFDKMALNFTYGFGLTDHGIMRTFDDRKSFQTATKSRQDRIQASISMIF